MQRDVLGELLEEILNNLLGAHVRSVRFGTRSGRFEPRSQRVSLRMQPDELMRAERVKPIRESRLAAKFDLEGIFRQNLDDCTDLARREAKLWNVGNQRHGIEQLDGSVRRHKGCHSGITKQVVKRGKSSLGRTIHAERTAAKPVPVESVKSIVYRWPNSSRRPTAAEA